MVLRICLGAYRCTSRVYCSCFNIAIIKKSIEWRRAYCVNSVWPTSCARLSLLSGGTSSRCKPYDGSNRKPPHPLPPPPPIHAQAASATNLSPHIRNRSRQRARDVGPPREAADNVTGGFELVYPPPGEEDSQRGRSFARFLSTPRRC